MGLFSRRKRARRGDSSVDATPTPTVQRTPRETYEALVDREWDRLARPGTWWTGGERLSIAADARRAATGDLLSGDLPGPVEEATVRLTLDPATIRGTDVARWDHEGLDGFAFVELAGIVSRVTALDVAAFGLDEKPRPLPEPETGEPTRERAPGGAITTGWAPTVGPAGAVSSLSAVTAESEAMFDLHGDLYLTVTEMADLGLERDGLSRPQIELVAARTSALNESYYCLLSHTRTLRACLSTNARTLRPAPIVTGVGDTGVALGALITAFVDAVVLHDEDELALAREPLEAELGKAAADRVAMIAGNFSMMNRALDAVGAPIDRGFDVFASGLGVAIPAHLAAPSGSSLR